MVFEMKPEYRLFDGLVHQLRLDYKDYLKCS